MWLICPFLGIACLWDYELRKIPNLLLFSAFGFGIIISFFLCGIIGVVWFILKVIITICVSSILFFLGMLGAGDVKLLGIVAGFIEFRRIGWFVFYSFLVAAIIGLIKISINKKLTERIKYFFEYVKSCQREGKLRLYMTERNEIIKNSVAMSFPILVSVLLGIGGLY